MVGDWSREPILDITGGALSHWRLTSISLQVEVAGRWGVAGLRVLLQVPPAGNIGILENLKKYQILELISGIKWPFASGIVLNSGIFSEPEFEGHIHHLLSTYDSMIHISTSS